MKKFMKRVGILLTLGATVFALCGCDALDEMREHQIFPESDGSLIIDGIHYVPLETNQYFFPAADYERSYYLTEPDVPVLLSQDYCIAMLRPSADGRFIRDLYRDLYFCREDLFEEMQAKNREPFSPEVLFYEYYAYNIHTYQYEDRIYTLSEEEIAAIRDVQQNTAPLQLGNGIYISFDWEVPLTAATKDMLFRHEGPTIGIAQNTYYLNVYTDGQAVTYQVPESYNPVFNQITVAYMTPSD